jgi:predicted ATPase/DNA-binding winged helix-turn-helix (wHTH) protein
MAPAGPARDAVAFGPFVLVASERLLTRNGVPVELGARSLDALIALVSRPNEVIPKRDLLAQVWPDVTVEEGSLRFHIASLRKALGDGLDGARYITTVAGRGYCFVAPLAHREARDEAPVAAAGARRASLPGRLMRMVGRADDVQALATLLAAARFVTVTGAGGVGKTTVAVAVGHDLIEGFAGDVLFVDLAALSDPGLVATSMASMLGLAGQSEDAAASLVAWLRDKRMLLILDSCEHLIEGVAALASRIFIEAAQVHILATSREALRVEGEQVYKLAALACPPDDPGLTATAVGSFPAAQLFLERAAASGAQLALDDIDAGVVADICRKLDGVALAIELAAGRVATYGVQQTAALLDQRLSLLWQGQRTAPPRQKTLQATLDWSFGLLSERERVVLRRLAVFVGPFTIEAALSVVPGGAVDDSGVFSAIDSLVAKSMVAVRPVGAMMRYRLLDTTRAYALEIGLSTAEQAELAARHAAWCRRWLEQIGAERPTLSNPSERAPHLAGLGNVRAALDWCFGPDGDAGLGVRLAAAAAPVFVALSLLTECHRWSERAIGALDDATRGGLEEMQLQSALGMALMFTHGQGDAALVALNRGLALAEAQGDVLNQVRLLGPLHVFHMRCGDFKAALRYAERSHAVAGTIDNRAVAASARCLLGNALYIVGDLARARLELEQALLHPAEFQGTSTIYVGLNHHILGRLALARTLWFQGHPEQAVERVRLAVKDAERTDHPVSLALTLQWAASILLWVGDLRRAEEHIDWFFAHADSHSLRPYVAVGLGLKGALAIRREDARSGVEALRGVLERLHEARYALLTTEFNLYLAQGLAALDRLDEGMNLVEDTIRRVDANGDVTYMPELLRVKGRLFLAKPPQRDGSEAETCFLQSLDASRRQGARAWELRTATDLAALWATQGDADRARALLQPALAQFTEGSDTADVKSATHLLATLA